MKNYEELISVAEEFAGRRHAGQVDKAGVDYINHPLTVASFVNDPKEKCVALLHDTVEDTGTTIDEIRELFGDEIAECISLLTRPEGMEYFDYLKRLEASGNITAMHVKLADLKHNSDISRLGEKAKEPKSLKRLEKYKKAKAEIENALKELEQTEGCGMRKILVVVDMQNDFIDGALGTSEAVSIVENVKDKIKSYPDGDIYATMDTHPENYLDTQEGKFLPVEHCIKDTEGWEIRADIKELLKDSRIFEKPTFGCTDLAKELSSLAAKEPIEIELIGLCTDICVVSNALLLKAYMPEVPIKVDASCCAGVTPEKHRAALETMKSCQIIITGE